MMVALKCPSCNADISIDDSREYGFCSYCGTKIQLVQKLKVVHSFEDAVDMNFASIRKLIDAGMYYDAQKKLEEIIQRHPENADAWVYLAYAKNRNFKIDFFNMKSIERAKDYIFKSFDNSIEIKKAKKLMDNENSPLYNELKSKFENSAKELFVKMETTTKQLIRDLNDNIFLLEGFFYDQESDGYDSAFFRNREDLICYYAGKYYIVNSVNHGLVSMSLDKNYYPSLVLKNERDLLWKIDYMDDRSVNFSGFRLYWRRDTTNYCIQYKSSLQSIRKAKGLCIYCGGKKGLFGCKNGCRF